VFSGGLFGRWGGTVCCQSTGAKIASGPGGVCDDDMTSEMENLAGNREPETGIEQDRFENKQMGPKSDVNKF
jgi:hypothetical protein